MTLESKVKSDIFKICLMVRNTNCFYIIRWRVCIFCTVIAYGVEMTNSGLDKDLDQWVFHPLLINLMSILLHI